MEEHANCDNVLEREKYHSMLNMDVLPVPDSEMALTEDGKEYEDPTKIFVKSRVTVCMLTLSVVTLSVCLISVIFFVRLEDGLQHEEAIYVLGKLFFSIVLSVAILNIALFQLLAKNQLSTVPDVPTSRVGDKFKVPATNTFQTFYNILNETFNFEFDSSSKIKFARD